MRKIAQSMMATGIGAWLALCAVAPANAITMPSLVVPTQTDIIQVHDHCHWHNGGGGHQWHGYDGYYDSDEGNGMLFKSLITGTFLKEPPQAYNDSDARSCANRYQSYRASDNTYQPSHGPRRVCR